MSHKSTKKSKRMKLKAKIKDNEHDSIDNLPSFISPAEASKIPKQLLDLVKYASSLNQPLKSEILPNGTKRLTIGGLTISECFCSNCEYCQEQKATKKVQKEYNKAITDMSSRFLGLDTSTKPVDQSSNPNSKSQEVTQVDPATATSERGDISLETVSTTEHGDISLDQSVTDTASEQGYISPEPEDLPTETGCKKNNDKKAESTTRSESTTGAEKKKPKEKKKGRKHRRRHRTAEGASKTSTSDEVPSAFTGQDTEGTIIDKLDGKSTQSFLISLPQEDRAQLSETDITYLSDEEEFLSLNNRPPPAPSAPTIQKDSTNATDQTSNSDSDIEIVFEINRSSRENSVHADPIVKSERF